MTATLPPQVREVFDRFISCEYTTIDSRQQPITWPVTPYYTDGGETIDVTTGLGYPKKADDAQRNPHVSLMFSEPAGSGIDSGIRVLVQGTATVDDVNLRENRERYWAESGEKLPATKDMHPPKLVRGLFNWYYTRIYVKVRPERVFVWSDGDHASVPEIFDCRAEEVRSGHIVEPLEPHADPAGGGIKWDERLDQLGGKHPTAVLSWVAPDGFPLSVRVEPQPDAPTKRISVGAEPAELPLMEGRACLTAHAHGPRFEWQENFQVRGDLTSAANGWELVPHKLIGGFELPDESEMARYRRNAAKSWQFYKTARKRLKTR